MLTLGSDLAPQQGRSEFLGAWMLVGDLGGTSGPLVTGKAAEALPLPATAWIAASAGILAALIFAFFVPETLKWRHIQDV